MGFTSSSHPDSLQPISYSSSQIHQAAARILAEVGIATQQHDTTWRQIHDWLTGLANALFAAADFLEGTDQQMANSFQPPRGYAP